MHAPESVDREAGEIRNVKVLGFESANGRTYTREAVEKACRMYEGAKVKLDHPKKSSLGEDRSFTETFGVLEGCHCKDDGLYADKLRYKKSHPSAELVAESAEKFSSTFGLSHNVRGKTEVREGKTHVIEIERVESVDVVDSPATTNGLFESEQMTTKTLREIREALPSDKKYNGLKATEARISLLSLCKTDAQREQLMEEWEDRKPVSRPDTSPAAKANPDLAFVPGSIKAAIGG